MRQQAREGAVGIERRVGGRLGCAKAALPVEVALALGAGLQVRLHQLLRGRVQRAGQQAGQQLLHRLVGFEVEIDDVLMALLIHGWPSNWPESSGLRRRRAWNIRVLTVLTGQSMTAAISA